MKMLDELDQLYFRNLIRGLKLKIAKRELDKKRTSTSTKQH